jgi:hypothetical protein
MLAYFLTYDVDGISRERSLDVSESQSRSHRIGKWLLNFVIVALLIVGPVVYLLCVAPRSLLPTPATCPEDKRIAAGHRKKGGLPVLDLKDRQSSLLSFGRALEAKSLPLEFEVLQGPIPGKRRLALRKGVFRRDDDTRIPPKLIGARAKVSGDDVILWVCVDRSPESQATADDAENSGDEQKRAPIHDEPDPGVYSGTITITDRRVSQVSVPLTIHLSYPYWNYVALLVWAAMLIGTLYVFALRVGLKEATEILSTPNLKRLWEWCKSWGGLVSIALGGASALGVFVATYLEADDWGTGVAQSASLFAAMLGAFIAAGSTPHIVKNVGGTSTAEETHRAEETTTVEKPSTGEGSSATPANAGRRQLLRRSGH